MLTFITGGARSGKSRYAEGLAAGYDDVTYIATATASDDEMKGRIALHKSRRPAAWQTIEAYRGLGGIVAGLRGTVIIDCLTAMLANIALETPLADDMRAFDWDALTSSDMARLEQHVMGEAKALCDGIIASDAHCILVTNELGMGLAPPYPLGRAFRDAAGRANAMFAAIAQEAVLMVSGLPVKLK